MKNIIIGALAIIGIIGSLVTYSAVRKGLSSYAPHESQEERDSSSLEYVFEIVRHGARTPVLDDPKFAPLGNEELT